MNELHPPNVCITRAVHTEIFDSEIRKKGSLFCADTRMHKHAERDDRLCRHVPSY
jgi:hypothetical protein